ncbi:hypothetical protein [uncultured Microbacterium sp.]|uniref:hypothetical protein n=1 Tax=uncultured Microbacterium sp. TaxID=191216 RepID=UPI0028DBC71B|nr:hypothetical protein [uncultured Microbacterium sp.]
MRKGVGPWPTLSGPNKDGGRHIGVRVLPDARAQLEARGFVVANQMYARSVDPGAVRTVRVGDVFDVRFDGDKGWWVWGGETRLGRLTWSLSSFEAKEWREGLPRIDDGTIQIVRLVLNPTGQVVNAGGIVRPRGVEVPAIEDAVPYAEVYIPTLRAKVSGTAVTVQSENVPEAPRVGSQPTRPEDVPSKSFWARVLRR